MDEREELEPYLRLILHDPNETPHGPAEIADIFTHKLSIQKLTGMAAFILKGRSFKTVRPRDVAHQIYRLEKIAGLAVAIFAAPGTVLDSAKEQFLSTALRLGCNHAIFDAVDLARSLACLSRTVCYARATREKLSLGGACAVIRQANAC